MMDDQRNLLIAIVLSLVVLVTFQVFFAPPPPPQAPQETQQGQTIPQGADPDRPVPQLQDGAEAPGAAPRSREAALAAYQRVRVENPRVKGSIALTGARIDDLTLLSYRETIEPDSPLITLMSPRGTPNGYYADFGWSPGGAASADLAVPGPDTQWTADGETLAPDSPVTLRWDNGAGLTFELVYAIDEKYMLTVTQRVTNSSGQDHVLFPYGRIVREELPETTGFWVLHEGLIGVFNEELDGQDFTLSEVDYDEVMDEGQIPLSSRGGWLGITDKYWLVALIPDQETVHDARFLHKTRDRDIFQADFVKRELSVPAGQSVETTARLFAGAKIVSLLNEYQENLGIARFEMAIDWGWFFFLTKPIFLVLDYLNRAIGNFGVAILVLTVLVKLIFFPLANHSYKAMSKMKKIAPELTQIRERHADDKLKMNEEMMALYKREKVNPASGCFPILIQIPVFFALYKVLFVTIEMRHAPFFGWIQDLSAADPTSIINLFGLIPWWGPEDVPAILQFINLGVWPILMGITMFLQQQLNPPPPDEMQRKIFMFLPILFTFMLAPFPAGLVIYWAWNNFLSILQQMAIMKRMGVNILEHRRGSAAAGSSKAGSRGGSSGSD
ncbi:MAG: membrane protein insertase YidC [Alphaproteobacteria bacterium]|nr:membrane protein insertase YidC [Alphaproteobacteria bacterium]